MDSLKRFLESGDSDGQDPRYRQRSIIFHWCVAVLELIGFILMIRIV